MLVTASPETLQHVLCIWYLVQFQAQQIKAFINSVVEVNVIILDFTPILVLNPKLINLCTQKIDDFFLTMYGIVLASFLLPDNEVKVRFFEKAFQLTDTSIETVLEMSFLALSNVKIQFGVEMLTWKSQSPFKVLAITG